jgi:hypothetical protein
MEGRLKGRAEPSFRHLENPYDFLDGFPRRDRLAHHRAHHRLEIIMVQQQEISDFRIRAA